MELFHDISIVVLSRDNCIYLERCLRSCLAQTLPGLSYEVIVVADKNQDYVLSVLNHYEQHVTPVISEKKLDFNQSIIAGLKQVSGRYVMLVDAHDFISDYALLFQSIFLFDNSEYAGVAVDYWTVERDGDKKLERINGLEKPLIYGVLCRKEVFTKALVIKDEKKKVTEATLTEHLIKTTKVGYIPISFYRRQNK